MPAVKLRDYQGAAVDAALNWIRYKPDSNGYIKAPGGSGKSVMIAAVAEAAFDMGLRVVCLARSEKLIRQNYSKFHDDYKKHIGIFCAGLNERDLTKPITIASIQSIGKHGLLLPETKLCLIDEIQNLSQDEDDDTQYRQFLRELGNPQIIGFTATDFRTSTGELTFGEKIADIPIEPLFEQGYIIRPVNKATYSPDLAKVQILRGEYSGEQIEDIYTDPVLLAATIETLQAYTSIDRQSVVIFCSSRKHGKVLQEAMADNGMPATFIDGETSKIELNEIILPNFEARKFKYLINVGLLIEGWDCPSIDCIMIVLSTLSKGKFEQIIYRGTRPNAPRNKKDFLVLDMGGNFTRHGPLGSPYKGKPKRGEALPPQGRICPECESAVFPLNALECPDCGYVFPESAERKTNHNHSPDMTSTAYHSNQPVIEIYEIMGVSYKEHKSKKGNTTLRVSYHCDRTVNKYGSVLNEYLSPFSSSDWARDKAWKYFRDGGHPLASPIETYSMDDLLWHTSQLKKPSKVHADMSGEFPDIKRLEYSEALKLPAPALPTIQELIGDDEIPW